MNNLIEENIKSHNKIYKQYDKIHGEIFNDLEQRRLSQLIAFAIDKINTNSNEIIALDYGCGSGNLTRHFIEHGCITISADVSNKFLKLIDNNYGPSSRLSTLLINGKDLENLQDDFFDIIGIYSVLHHIPDYLGILHEMVTKLKKGGIIYIDHEVNPSYWDSSKEYNEYIKMNEAFDVYKLQKIMIRIVNPTWYVNRIHKYVDPGFLNESDIHVWPDDHIEWSNIENIFINNGFTVILSDDYLLYRRGHNIDLYNEYKSKCNDMRVMIMRKD